MSFGKPRGQMLCRSLRRSSGDPIANNIGKQRCHEFNLLPFICLMRCRLPFSNRFKHICIVVKRFHREEWKWIDAPSLKLDEVDEIPVEPHDVGLDAVVSCSRVALGP